MVDYLLFFMNLRASWCLYGLILRRNGVLLWENMYLCTQNKNNTMKKILFIVLTVVLTMTTACSDKKERGANDFAIEGTISGAADKMMYLQLVAPDEVKTVDSVKLDKDGRFEFFGPRPKAPEIYRLSLDNRYIYVSIDSMETVTVNATYPKLADYSVKGSDNCLKLKALNAMHAALQQKVRQIEMSQDLFPGQARDSLINVINAYKEKVKEDFMMVGPQHAYAYYALFQTIEHVSGEKTLIYSPYSKEDLWAFGCVANCWKEFHKDTERAKKLEELYLAARQELRKRNQPIDESLISEAGIFEIELPDAFDVTHRLSDLKGQVVVLNFNDFHAAESGAIILALRELYNRYHEQGLEIYQVGVVQDAHWWRQSVDKLPWVNVLDQSGYYAKLYNVQALGDFFIIDRNNMLQQRVGIDGLEQAVVSLL